MSGMLLANVDPAASDDEIREFLVKYGFPPFTKIEHFEGDGSQPSVLLSFDELDTVALTKLQSRVDHVYWKHRELRVRILQDRFR
ncbi:hypothetical protein [Piscinibacter gummiphilus]|uniref:Uncharacterized protein n=1 Tax=Piscinibacter gummiphilus TaxID=946333 RepID=A0A1W6L7N2_9BURK|nr:hypothetical protein [Piscinibacter gummiphilus]ARN20242.1 hypothetical protein A4W93_10195 [Piscinibacter gummiphilus]ATU64913.1 hypothetical protein CPZ87_10270 [Piscinibacter gummiphilus]GLS96456.1 hypothetical protein GCM10007918_37480 [Piscinibacter gummiphilus]